MKRRGAISSGPSLDLFRQPHLGAAIHAELVWPPLDRFPLNLNDRSVQDKVIKDLQQSPAPLIVTGYASLDQVIDFVANCPRASKVRILFGQEPFESYRETYELKRKSLSDEIRDYWLERGISVLLSGKVIDCIARLKSGTFKARYPSSGERLHAKIYCSEEAATLGSSNFTRAGLKNQLEANCRYLRKGDKARYDQTVNKDLEEICDHLRQRLGPDVEDINELTPAADRCLQHFIQRLSFEERFLISNKKQKALDQMEKVIGVWLKTAASEENQHHLDAYQALLDMLQNRDTKRQPDWDEVASRWLDIIRPVWYERLTARGRRKPLLLKDIRRDLSVLEGELGGEVIRSFISFPLLSPPDERIAACIIGIK